jgi:hypothetical protein
MVGQATVLVLGGANKVDEEERQCRGSQPGKSADKNHAFRVAFDWLIQRYISGCESVFNEINFEQQFCVSRDVFT